MPCEDQAPRGLAADYNDFLPEPQGRDRPPVATPPSPNLALDAIAALKSSVQVGDGVGHGVSIMSVGLGTLRCPIGVFLGALVPLRLQLLGIDHPPAFDHAPDRLRVLDVL